MNTVLLSLPGNEADFARTHFARRLSHEDQRKYFFVGSVQTGHDNSRFSIQPGVDAHVGFLVWKSPKRYLPNFEGFRICGIERC